MEKKKILLVDDEPDFIEIMSVRIKSWGYDLISASDGKKAIEAVKNNNPDIVILDYLLPDIDGITVLKEMRKINKKLPVIIFTAYPDKAGQEGWDKLEVSAVIPKLSVYSEVIPSLEAAIHMIEKKLGG